LLSWVFATEERKNRSSIRLGACGTTDYCIPLVTFSKIQGGLAV